MKLEKQLPKFLNESKLSENNLGKHGVSHKINKSAIVLMSVGLLNFIHGMLHVVQFLQSIMLFAYSTETSTNHPDNLLYNLLHNPYLAFIWAVIGILTFIIGVKDYRHHLKCGKGHKH